MAERTGIEWCDCTFNPWIGCEEVSPACDHCYARDFMTRKPRWVTAWSGDRYRTSESYWHTPIRWNSQALAAGVRRKVFCASLADVFDETVQREWREDLWHLIRITPQLDWLLLTKRPQFISKMNAHTRPIENVWLGTTVENQEEADRRIPDLLAAPARVHFLSCEPLLGPVDLSLHMGQWPIRDRAKHRTQWKMGTYNNGIDWVISGGESGPNARPMDPNWARSLRDQCEAARVPFFLKQWGDWAPLGEFEAKGWERTGSGDAGEVIGRLSGELPGMTSLFGGRSFPTRFPFRNGPDPGACMVRVGKRIAGALLDGEQHRAFPA